MTTRRISSFAGMLQRFAEADEILFTGRSGLSEETIVELCREARRRARHMLEHYGGRGAAEIAAALGVRIVRTEWQVAAGRIIYFGECSLHPPEIRLNHGTIGEAARNAALWIEAEPNASDEHTRQRWMTGAVIEEVMIAHELFHLLSPQTPLPEAEWSARVFARMLCAMPFSPLLYHQLCARSGRFTPPQGWAMKSGAN